MEIIIIIIYFSNNFTSVDDIVGKLTLNVITLMDWQPWGVGHNAIWHVVTCRITIVMTVINEHCG